MRAKSKPAKLRQSLDQGKAKRKQKQVESTECLVAVRERKQNQNSLENFDLTMLRFISKTKLSDSGCLEWIGEIGRQGYGRFAFNGHPVRAHRVAWILKNGAIPDGIGVLHKCDNKKCVNVDHLFLGTQADNMDDLARKFRWNKSSLTPSDILEIRKMRSSGLKLREIAEKFPMSLSGICGIALGQTWKYAGYTKC